LFTLFGPPLFGGPFFLVHIVGAIHELPDLEFVPEQKGGARTAPANSNQNAKAITNQNPL
jgi:hypothetical protein